MTVGPFPHDPAARGYGVAYRPGETNRCPGCGRSHWHVGRVSAECAFCETALPLVGTTQAAGRRTERKAPNVDPSET